MEIIKSNEFDSVVSKGVVLVDFFATWCGPCKMIAPVLEKLSAQYSTVNFVKVDVDESGDIAQRYGIQSIPTLFIFKDGEIVERQVGFLGEPQIKALLEKHK